jgi:hypothetical protein
VVVALASSTTAVSRDGDGGRRHRVVSVTALDVHTACR